MEKESLPQLNVEDIRRAAGAVMTPGHREGKFLGVSTDSRHIEKGNLFVALVGEHFDGHDFLKMAVAAGATGLVIQRDRKGKANSLPADVTVLRVEDTLKALGILPITGGQNSRSPSWRSRGAREKQQRKRWWRPFWDRRKQSSRTRGTSTIGSDFR